MPLKLKDEHRNTVVGFNKSSLPLGQRSDLHLLFGLSAKNPKILDYFSELPTESEFAAMSQEHSEKTARKSLKFKDESTNTSVQGQATPGSQR